MDAERRQSVSNAEVLNAIKHIEKQLDDHMNKEEPILHKAQVNMERAEAGLLEVSTPGGFKGKLSGIDTKILLLAVLITAGIGWIGYQWQQDRVMDQNSKADYLAQHKITQTLLGNVITNQKAIIEVVRDSQMKNASDLGEVTYMLTLDQKRREALRLDMPETLRRKIIQR